MLRTQRHALPKKRDRTQPAVHLGVHRERRSGSPACGAAALVVPTATPPSSSTDARARPPTTGATTATLGPDVRRDPTVDAGQAFDGRSSGLHRGRRSRGCSRGGQPDRSSGLEPLRRRRVGRRTSVSIEPPVRNGGICFQRSKHRCVGAQRFTVENAAKSTPVESAGPVRK